MGAQLWGGPPAHRLGSVGRNLPATAAAPGCTRASAAGHSLLSHSSGGRAASSRSQQGVLWGLCPLPTPPCLPSPRPPPPASPCLLRPLLPCSPFPSDPASPSLPPPLAAVPPLPILPSPSPPHPQLCSPFPSRPSTWLTTSHTLRTPPDIRSPIQDPSSPRANSPPCSSGPLPAGQGSALPEGDRPTWQETGSPQGSSWGGLL